MKFHVMGMQQGEQRVAFHCPGCQCGHQIAVTGPRAWQWNGSLDKPTVTPSISVNRDSANPEVPRCHSYVTDGKIKFLADSTHELAGKTVDLPEWED